MGAPRVAQSLPADGRRQEDPLLGGPSRMQQRRMEIEAELRRGYNMPDPHREAERVPLFGRPPPAPKPQGARDRASAHLPPIHSVNQSASSPPPHDPSSRPESWRKPSYWQQPQQASSLGEDEEEKPSPPPLHEMPNVAKPRVSLRGAHEAREQ